MFVFLSECPTAATNADGIGLCECAANFELIAGAPVCTGMYQEYFSRSNSAVFIQLGFWRMLTTRGGVAFFK